MQYDPLTAGSTFYSSGMVNVSAGAVLRLAGGGTASGAFDAAGGALVNWTADYTLNTGAQLRGDGVYRVSGGRLSVNGDVPVWNLDLEGILGGTNTLTVSNVLNWTAGAMDGGGRTVIAPGALLNLTNASDVTLSGRTLENGGTVIWTGAGAVLGGSAVITNRAGALWEVRNDSGFTWAAGGSFPRFDNAGTFRKSQGTGTTAFSLFAFTNWGTLSVRQGNVSFGSAPVLHASSTVEFGLSGVDYPINYGRITTSELLQLTGGLAVTFRNGYLPGPGLSFDIITAPVSGVFQTYTAASISPYVFINPVYKPNAVQLVTADPTPALTNLGMDAQGRFTLTIHGIAGQVYVVEASTNFVTWTPLATNTMPASTIWLFVDEDSATIPFRFYRVRFQPQSVTPGAPYLTVFRTATNTVVVSWPGPAEGWVLEATNALPAISVPWPQIPPPYQTNATEFFYVEPPPTTNRFYRLHKP